MKYMEDYKVRKNVCLIPSNVAIKCVRLSSIQLHTTVLMETNIVFTSPNKYSIINGNKTKVNLKLKLINH